MINFWGCWSSWIRLLFIDHTLKRSFCLLITFDHYLAFWLTWILFRFFDRSLAWSGWIDLRLVDLLKNKTFEVVDLFEWSIFKLVDLFGFIFGVTISYHLIYDLRSFRGVTFFISPELERNCIISIFMACKELYLLDIKSLDRSWILHI